MTDHPADELVQNPSAPQSIVPIQAGPPGEVSYVAAASRPELIFNERVERDTLERVRALQAARDAIVEDANSVVIGARY